MDFDGGRKKIFLVCLLPLLGLLEAVTTSSEVTDLPWDWPRPPTGDWNGSCLYFFLHCKEPIPKIQNKYSQKRNCAATVPISTFICLWAIYIFPPLICLTCCRKYVDQSCEYINRSQTHECGNWDWGRAIPRKEWDFRCSVGPRGSFHHILRGYDLATKIFFWFKCRNFYVSIRSKNGLIKSVYGLTV